MKPKLVLIGNKMLRKVLNREFLRKAVSAVIGAIIIAGVFIIILFPLMSYTMNAFQRQEQMFQASRSLEIQKTLENIELRKVGNILYINNTGPIRTGIKYLIIKYRGDTYFVDIYGFRVADEQGDEDLMYPLKLIGQEGMVNISTGLESGYVILEPEGYMKIQIEEESVEIFGVVTTLGNYFPYKEETYAEIAGSVIVQPIVIAGTLEELVSRPDISVNEEYVKEPKEGELGKGMRRYGAYMILYEEYEDVDIVTSESDDPEPFWFGAAYIGLEAHWTRTREGSPKYTIMLTPYRPGFLSVIKIKSKEGEKIFTPDSEFFKNGMKGWRIVIEGFKPEDPENPDHLRLRYVSESHGIDVEATGFNTLGIWWIYGGRDVVDESWIKLKGHADKVKIYVAKSGNNQFSYAPFFVSMDIDNNGIAEFIFMTEDSGYGFPFFYPVSAECLINECGYYGNDYVVSNNDVYYFVDWSVRPFWINLTGYQISSDDYAMVQVAIRLYFHDNIGYDTDEVEHTDRVLFGVYLIDAETGEIVSSREFIYQELDDLEDTYPPHHSFFIQTISLIVPATPGKTYYIGIAFQDPYSNCEVDSDLNCEDYAYYDDGDFITAIEWLGVAYYARP